MEDNLARVGSSESSGARGERVECAECGVLITPDRADYADGDGGMIPDRWFCRPCQESDCAPDYDDDDDYCYECDGEGVVITCFDDLCVGAGECMHGDGEELCPSCHGGY